MTCSSFLYSSRGATFSEVLVAMALTMIGLIGAMGAFETAGQTIGRGMFATRALALARSMESLPSPKSASRRIQVIGYRMNALLAMAGVVAIAALVLTVYTPSIRSFFEFTEVQALDWTIVIIASAGALAGQFLITRYWQEIVDVLLATPGEEAERGRAT